MIKLKLLKMTHFSIKLISIFIVSSLSITSFVSAFTEIVFNYSINDNVLVGTNIDGPYESYIAFLPAEINIKKLA